ncbi:NADPH-dependent glutamate synthase [Proteiniclasticum sp. BAD-10]|uniref:NADPH-dependent glutamate synthase n=1 Tax=Proteiniclasticum sediminis TaxID=2804028 RepID=A0A941CRB9_9CLOT|nr:NADPH-dependent glutamate synthase [Proteiniclasticum sediminis]MBR0575928.1 NADPH-dependent glutamate synthase [Proteiniclasticum sediminis]
MKLDRVPVREQEPAKRILNFQEVSYGYNQEEAVEEASRCLQCKNPKCVGGCPVAIDIPKFIRELRDGDMKAARDTLGKSSNLPAVCGRVCPQEEQCEGKCIVGIRGTAVNIGKLERYVADWAMAEGYRNTEKAPSNHIKVAVIGSGPAGLTCAGDLAKLGYEVTIFEALHEPGGVLVYGIPEFRLPKEKVVREEIKLLLDLGVTLETNVIVGRTVSVENLMKDEDFKAVFIGSGAGLPMFMGIKGENANGVMSANEYLTRANLMKAFRSDYDTPISHGKKVVVVGAGNVAMDAARTAVRLGAEARLVYRRSEKEIPARAEEVHHAVEEGVILNLLTNPKEILVDEKGFVKGMVCVKMTLGEPDASGRRKPLEMEGTEHVIDCDSVIMSLGTSPNPLIASTTPGIETNRRGCILINEENGETTSTGIFAGGDAVTGSATVILAMSAGKKAAQGIHAEMVKKGLVPEV